MKGSRVITNFGDLDPMKDKEQVDAIIKDAHSRMSSIPTIPGSTVTMTLKPHGKGWSSKIRATFTREKGGRIVVMEVFTFLPITTSDIDIEKKQKKPKAHTQAQAVPSHMVPVEAPQLQATI